MKKIFLAALLSAGIMNAGTSSAAPHNPFEDVPSDHWAYDAIARLASDGIIEGYGDGTYRGDMEITRYEMAQMVARAMARNPKGEDKALMDKLAAEFSDELSNLGVRVANLEKKADNVRWRGNVRYRYVTEHREKDMQHQSKYNMQFTNGHDHTNTNEIMLRLWPQFKINENWTGFARITYYGNMHTAENISRSTVFDWAWAEGRYNKGNTVIKLGKLFYRTESDYHLFMFDAFAGAQLTVGDKIKATFSAGRYDFSNINMNLWYAPPDYRGGYDTGDYLGLEIYNDRKSKFTWGVSYHRVHAKDRYDYFGLHGETANIAGIGLGYNITPTLSLRGAFLHNFNVGAGKGRFEDISGFRNAYAIDLRYKQAHPAKPGSFGIFIGYRHLGPLAILNNTYRVNSPVLEGDKGWEIGASYTLAPGVLGTVRYFRGKEIVPSGEESLKRNAFLGEVNFFFM